MPTRAPTTSLAAVKLVSLSTTARSSSKTKAAQAATIITCLMWVIAVEYSCELSAKVFAGQCRLIRLSFQTGRPSGLGTEASTGRWAPTPEGPVGSRGAESVQTDRVILTPCPPDEIKTVRRLNRQGRGQGRRLNDRRHAEQPARGPGLLWAGGGPRHRPDMLRRTFPALGQQLDRPRRYRSAGQ